MALLPHEVYYENTRGQRLYLSRAPYVMKESTLFDRKWKLTTSQRPLGEGGRLIGRRRPCDERSMTVSVFADTADALSELLSEMAEIFDYDVEVSRAGRLYIGGRYLSCWCASDVKELSCDFTAMATVKLSVHPEYPCWCTEKKYSFSTALTQSEDDGHSYPYAYSYRYGLGRPTLNIGNEHFSPSPMRIYFFGQASSPSIYVAGNRIGVNVELAEGEYAVVDQLTREVYKVDASGKRINCFDRRVKNGKTFGYAPSGVSLVELDSDGGVDIILIEQRSEPQWA
ncbi:MAG: hypothetical protein IJC18_04430 [Clostridia bacterium]|nr:hypothetical protein [Clostridia bacterium]